jgi:hypothetical protein
LQQPGASDAWKFECLGLSSPKSVCAFAGAIAAIIQNADKQFKKIGRGERFIKTEIGTIAQGQEFHFQICAMSTL